MNKIICDVCGTQYPDTMERCPICGYAREIAAQPQQSGYQSGRKAVQSGYTKTKGGRFSAANVQKRNQTVSEPVVRSNQKNPVKQQAEPARSGGNTFLIILLVVLIMTLLATTAYIFLHYLLPNTQAALPTEETGSTIQTTEATDPTEENAEIPCEALALTSGGTISFTAKGEMSLLNVVIIPGDSTDELTFTSSDESVATVNDEGRVTCVGEGEAVITISCGKRQMQCSVSSVFPTETEPSEDTTGAAEE